LSGVRVCTVPCSSTIREGVAPRTNSHLLHASSLEQGLILSQRSEDVLILGGGVIGLACAYALLKAGRHVTVLEQETVGSGASHGNCGTITPSVLPLPAPGVIAKGLRWLFKSDAPLRIQPRVDLEFLRWFYVFMRHCNERDFRHAARARSELLLASRKLLGDLIRSERLDCEFHEGGTFYVHRDQHELERASQDAQLLAELGVAVEVLNARAARMKEPALNNSVAGGHYFPGDASLRPDRYVAELARIVRAEGGVIHEQTAVHGFRTEGGSVSGVVTPQGHLGAREFVVALGAWSPVVTRGLGLRLPIQPGKGYSITYDMPLRAPVLPLFLKERAVCVTPLQSGFRLGSTMEFAGYDSTLNPARLHALVRGAREYLTFQSTGIQEEWFGWRPMTPDDLPILGRAPGFRNLTLATGHGMLGLSLSAITGLLIAEVIAGCPPSLDLEPFSPARFSH
jgi:D-amino-acid dehydrogenase